MLIPISLRNGEDLNATTTHQDPRQHNTTPKHFLEEITKD
jgi:hypothetical protein